jgi:hypothetical protein
VPPAEDTGDDLAVYVVAATGADDLDAVMAGLDSIALNETLYLVRTDLTQSKLHHRMKQETAPTTLFLGRLEGFPKFKGVGLGCLGALGLWWHFS